MLTKSFKKLVVFTLVFVMLVGVAPVSAATTKISKEKATLEVDSTLTLKLNNSSGAISWKSSDKAVATVSQKGKITAKGEGIATITASSSGNNYKCTVTVVDSNKTSDNVDATDALNGIPKLKDNSDFKVVKSYTYSKYSYTYYVYKVEALKTIDASVKLTISDKKGNILDTAEDSISLSKGKQNFFRLSVEKKFADETNTFVLKSSSSNPFWDGAEDAVKVVRYNQSGDTLYITVKQTKDDLGEFAQLKMLFFNNGNLVNTEELYYDIYAEELSGKGTESLMEIWIYGVTYTDIEFFFQDR